ncbi:hypothetical protein [Aliikangiella maris]|uniref:Uncharacterized protein n=2 Tax=Aliikangiella maris TaxID=3162458 RepID=A0ABV3MIK8_9GAMM
MSEKTHQQVQPQRQSQPQSQPERRFVSLIELLFVVWWLYLYSFLDGSKVVDANLFASIIYSFFFCKYFLSRFVNSYKLYRDHFKSGAEFSEKYKGYLFRSLITFFVFAVGSFLLSQEKIIYLLNIVLLSGLGFILTIKVLLFKSFIIFEYKVDAWAKSLDKFEQPPNYFHWFGLIGSVSALFYVGLFSKLDLVSNLTIFVFSFIIWSFSVLSLHNKLKLNDKILKSIFFEFNLNKLVVVTASLFITVVTYSKLNTLSGLNGSDYPLTLSTVFIFTLVLIPICYLVYSGIAMMPYLPPLAKSGYGQKIKWLFKALFKGDSFTSSDDVTAYKGLQIRSFYAIHYVAIYFYIGVFALPFIKNIDSNLGNVAFEFDLNDKVHCGELIKQCSDIMPDHKYVYLDPSKVKFSGVTLEHRVVFNGQCNVNGTGDITFLNEKLLISDGNKLDDCRRKLSEAFKI